MPRKYYNKNKNRLRRRKRNYLRKLRYRKLTVAQSMGPLAMKVKARMLYVDQFSLNPGVAGVLDQYVFSMNGLYAPNLTGSSHQPRGFDQLMLLYDHYLVIGSKITLIISNPGTSSNDTTIVTITPRDNGSWSSPTPEDVLENRVVKTTVVGPSGSSNASYLSMQANPCKFLGRSSPLSDPDLKGDNSANPLEQAYWHLHAIPSKNAQDTSSIDITAKIEYTTIFFEPKQPSQS